MKRMTSAVALIAASLLGLTACGSSDDPLASSTPTGSASASASGGPIVVGGANFSESTLLAEIYAGALKAKGIDATTKLNIGSREMPITFYLIFAINSMKCWRSSKRWQDGVRRA